MEKRDDLTHQDAKILAIISEEAPLVKLRCSAFPLSAGRELAAKCGRHCSYVMLLGDRSIIRRFEPATNIS